MRVFQFLVKWCNQTCCHLLLRCPIVYDLWCMIYNLLGMQWVSMGSMFAEVWAWGGIYSGKSKDYFTNYFLGYLKKKRNLRVLGGLEVDRYKQRDRWFKYFGFFILGHEIIRDEDLGMSLILLQPCKFLCIWVVPPLVPY